MVDGYPLPDQSAGNILISFGFPAILSRSGWARKMRAAASSPGVRLLQWRDSLESPPKGTGRQSIRTAFDARRPPGDLEPPHHATVTPAICHIEQRSVCRQRFAGDPGLAGFNAIADAIWPHKECLPSIVVLSEGPPREM